MKLRLTQKNHSIDVELISTYPLVVQVDGNEYIPDIVQISENLYSVIINNESWFLSFLEKPPQVNIIDSLQDNRITTQNELDIRIEELGFSSIEDENAGEIYASIPGLITKLFVKEGDCIEKGHHVCVLEAMKMENEICSPISGAVKSIQVYEGDSVEKGTIIMEII
jgi:biotin carboxyl carrier protein